MSEQNPYSHPKVQMPAVETSDRMAPETVAAWIPVLDALEDHDGFAWKLDNTGPGWNNLLFDADEDSDLFVPDEPALFIGQYEKEDDSDGWTKPYEHNVTFAPEDMHGVSILVDHLRPAELSLIETLEQAVPDAEVEEAYGSMMQVSLPRKKGRDYAEWIGTVTKALNICAGVVAARA